MELVKSRYSVQDKVALWVCILGAFFGFVFASVAFKSQNITLGIIDMIAGTILLFNGLWILKKPGILAQKYTIVILCVTFFFYLFVTGGSEQSGYIWGILVAIAPVFFLGLHAGAATTALYLVFLLGAYFMGEFFFPHHEMISVTSLVRFIGAYVTAGIIAFIYEKGRSTYESAIVKEMHDRDEAELKLKISEKNYRLLMEHAVSAIVVHELIVDGDGKPVDYVFTSANAAFETHTGLKVSEVIGRRVSEILPGIEESPFLQIYGRVVQRGEAVSFEEFSAPLNRHFLINAYPLDASRFATVFTDITERKHIEMSLQDNELRLRGITNSAQDAIIMIDPLGLITFWNPAAETILGYKTEEVIGRNLHELVAPERFMQAHQEAFPEFVKHGRGNAVGQTVELAARRKDGEEIIVDLSLSAVSLHGQWHAVGILRDITEKKHSEQSLMESNRELEAANIRSRELAERAEMASVAKSEFLANMSHEIRTPMNGVIGMTGLLLDTELNEEQRRFAEIVHASAESLLSLINDILDFSKIEAGKLDLEILDFDLQSLMDDFASTIALRTYAKGLELTCASDPAVPTQLKGDPGRLRQVLNNLTGNAIKFTHKGEIAVFVEVIENSAKAPEDNLPETSPTVLLRFSVRDTGIGIPNDKIGMLFEKFTQADASTTRQYGGTGLGLSISKQLAELMGGEIGVSSEEGKGSEFWFTARLGIQTGIDNKKARTLADLSGVHALIVDDNATNREILMARLASWGMRPFETEDASAALKALQQASADGDPFQLAIIDMQMPGMDGDELGRTIKSDKKLAGTPLVMLTSMGTRGDARHFQEIGFDGYITKPIRQEELRGLLAQVLARYSGSVPASHPIATRHSVRETIGLFTHQKLRVLLAEDNVTNQQVALGILKKFGLSADAVANGYEVLSALKSIPYDLILMDVQMPDMDGLEATRLIRERETGQSNSRIHNGGHIPIVAMTAHAMQGDREKCIEAGMDDYITKPIVPQTLADVLKKWLPETQESNIRDQTSEFDGPQTAAMAVFDRAALLDRLMEDEELVQTILDGFLADIPRQIEILKNCLDNDDMAGVERQSHSIKGAAANVSAEALRVMAHGLEEAARGGNSSYIRDQLVGLETTFNLLKKEMER